MDIGFDITSYVMGLKDGRKVLRIDSDTYEFLDPELDGHIAIKEKEDE